MENSHIGELNWSKVQRKGFIRDHWVIFGTGLIIFKYFPFFNYYFGVKVFGTSMWCWTMWMLFNRMIAKTCRRNEFMAAQKTAQEVMDGEDAIVDAMKRFSNDAKCADDLASFRTETEAKIAEYKKAVVVNLQEDMSQRVLKQLQSVAQFEAGMGSALQDLVVREAAASFRQKFPQDSSLEAQAFSAALKSLSGASVSTTEDPVANHFTTAFAGLAEAGNASADAKGTLSQRVAHAQSVKESEFKQTFMVTADEVKEIQSLIKGAGQDVDVTKLSPDALKKLEDLHTAINAKVGFVLPELASKPIPASSDLAAQPYVDGVNAKLAEVSSKLAQARLKAFAQAFA